MMKIGVTACSGRLGRALLRELTGPERALDRQGNGIAEVVAIARTPERVDAPGVERRAGDYESVGSMTDAFTGLDTVVMISAPVASGSDRVRLHRNVIEAARKSGVRKLLFTSVIGNGRERDTGFWATQQVNRQTEEDVAASGLEWVIGRNGMYLELDVIQILRAADGGVYTNPAGEGRCPYISIDEIAYAFARLAEHDGHSGMTYNIVGESRTQAELVGLANEVFGTAIRYQPISDAEMLDKFRRLMPERGEAVARMLTGVFEGIRAGAFDVPSDFEAAAGRPAKTVREMMEDIRRKQRAG